MKIRIKGDIDLKVIGESVYKTLKAIKYDHNRMYLRGATIFLNAYDRETHERIEFECEDGEAADTFLIVTPDQKLREEITKNKKRKKKKTIRID